MDQFRGASVNSFTEIPRTGSSRVNRNTGDVDQAQLEIGFVFSHFPIV